MNLYSYIVLSLLAVIVAILAVLLVYVAKKRSKQLRLEAQIETHKTSMKVLLPLKMQACERFVLFLERIKTPVLVKRIYQPGIGRDTFHLAMVQNVGDEFEHNLAQQLYVSQVTWEAIRKAKDEQVNQINALFEQSAPETSVALLAQALVTLPNAAIDEAVLLLRAEFHNQHY
ncbi:MAG: hypothetical protein ACTTKO_04470 [Candidatus Limimorpha sp.]